jgi:hypothetical protein
VAANLSVNALAELAAVAEQADAERQFWPSADARMTYYPPYDDLCPGARRVAWPVVLGRSRSAAAESGPRRGRARTAV